MRSPAGRGGVAGCERGFAWRGDTAVCYEMIRRFAPDSLECRTFYPLGASFDRPQNAFPITTRITIRTIPIYAPIRPYALSIRSRILRRPCPYLTQTIRNPRRLLASENAPLEQVIYRCIWGFAGVAGWSRSRGADGDLLIASEGLCGRIAET